MTTTLNHNLPSLPSIAGTPLNRPKNQGQLNALLDARYEAALEVSRNTLNLAATMIDRGDVTSARDLLEEAKLYQAEATAIAALRS